MINIILNGFRVKMVRKLTWHNIRNFSWEHRWQYSFQQRPECSIVTAAEHYLGLLPCFFFFFWILPHRFHRPPSAVSHLLLLFFCFCFFFCLAQHRLSECARTAGGARAKDASMPPQPMRRLPGAKRWENEPMRGRDAKSGDGRGWRGGGEGGLSSSADRGVSPAWPH